MAAQSLEFAYTQGQTLTARLFAIGSDTVVATASSVTQATNRKNRYIAAFEDVPAGRYLLIYSVGSVDAGSEIYELTLDEATFQPAGETVATLAKQDEILGAIGDIEGDSSVNVLPAVGISADRSPGVTLKSFVGETITQSITLYETNGTTPIVLTGKTLVIVFETRQGVDVATVANSNITVGGDDDNVVTFAYPAAATASERVLKFALRDASAPNTVYLQGLLSVQRAPQVD
jgi:hypothetical protein